MTPAICSRLAAAALMGAVSANAARAENGLTGISLKGDDGIYLVNVMTHRGDCDKDYKWMIMVSSGRVSSAGDAPMDASGQINSRGVVTLRFERFGQVANVTGRVVKGSGSGTWNSPTLQCSGSWRATRRGWADR
jgi:hypothetical protein